MINTAIALALLLGIHCGSAPLVRSQEEDPPMGVATSSKLQIIEFEDLIAYGYGSFVFKNVIPQIPQTLTKAGGYEHREALFGTPPYGGSIAQNMYYADDTMCDFNSIDTSAGYPIRAKGDDGNMLPWQSPYILMVDRGGCTFVQKVRNAQRVGAAGVIIADNSCLCSAKTCTSDPGVKCEEREPIMADDGSGSDISIPSFLMFKQDADEVKAEVMANHPVRIEMTWSSPSPDDRVEYELWATPTDPISNQFLMEFKEAAVALGKHAYFTPQMYIYDGRRSGCQGIDGENDCYNLCTNNGRYCATDPDNDLDRGISGADVVKESLRRMCIWKEYGQDDGVGAPWWDYVTEFIYRCSEENMFMNDKCVEDAMTHAGVDKDKMEQCMNDSGGLQGDVENNLMEVQLREKDMSGVVILPAIYVNRVLIRGSLELPVVFKAICAGYASGTMPTACEMCASCPDQKQCISQGLATSEALSHTAATAASTPTINDAWSYLPVKMPTPLSDMATSLLTTETATSGTQKRIILTGGCDSPDGNRLVEEWGYYECSSYSSKTYAFDPISNLFKAWSGEFEVLADMPRTRVRHSSTVVNGLLCVFGGRNFVDGLIAEVDCYDPDTNAWSTPFILPDEYITSDFAAHTAGDSEVYLMGGYNADYLTRNQVTIIDMSDMTNPTYTDGPELLEKRGDTDIAVLDGDVYISGGFTDENDWSRPKNSVEKYNAVAQTWQSANALKQERGDHQLVSANAKLFAFGGETKIDDAFGIAFSEVLDIVEVLDLKEDAGGSPSGWRTLSNMPTKLFRFAASEWEGLDGNDDGYIFVFGGQTSFNDDCQCFKNTDKVMVFDTSHAVQEPATATTPTANTITRATDASRYICQSPGDVTVATIATTQVTTQLTTEATIAATMSAVSTTVQATTNPATTETPITDLTTNYATAPSSTSGTATSGTANSATATTATATTATTSASVSATEATSSTESAAAQATTPPANEADSISSTSATTSGLDSNTTAATTSAPGGATKATAMPGDFDELIDASYAHKCNEKETFSLIVTSLAMLFLQK